MNELKWSISFIGGWFKFIYKKDSQIVDVWKCLKTGSEEHIAFIETNYPNIGEPELSLAGNAFIQGLLAAKCE